MAFIPALNTAKCTVVQEYLGQFITNTFHVQGSSPWVEATLQALADEIIDAWNAHVGPVQVDDCVYRFVKVKDMTTEEGFGMEVGFPTLSGGDRTGDNLPGNVALACRLITNYSGRNRRGRMFIGGFEEDQVDGNAFTSIAHAQIETNMRSFVQQINATGDSVVVASYYDNKDLVDLPDGQKVWRPRPRPTALLTPVTNVVVDRFTDSMRSRLANRGN